MDNAQVSETFSPVYIDPKGAITSLVQSFLLNLFVFLFQEKEDWVLTTAQPRSSPKSRSSLPGSPGHPGAYAKEFQHGAGSRFV